MHAKFSPHPANKLLRLELSYDVMCFMQQLRRASGKRYFEVVPNTISSATEDCDDPSDDSARVITTAEAPYTIVKVSRGWCSITGFSAGEAVGRTCAMLQGPETDGAKLRRLMDGVRAGQPSHAILTNYTREREKFTAFLRVCPLYSDGKVSHFIGLLERVTDTLSLQQQMQMQRDDLSANDALSATDSNMAIGYPPSPLSSLSSSSSANSHSAALLHSRLRRKDVNPLLAMGVEASSVRPQPHALPVVAAPGGTLLMHMDTDSTSTDQSMAMSANNEESRSGSGGSGNSSDPTRASDVRGMLPSLSGNTDRSNDTTVNSGTGGGDKKDASAR